MRLARRHLLLLAGLAGVGARAQSSNEGVVKARLVLNLLRFTQWPAEAGNARLLGVAVRSELQRAAFAELEGQTVGGGPLRVVLNPATLPAGCRALYVEADAERSAAALLAAATALPVLTVGDGDGFIGRGMVGLVNVNDAIRFEVNLARLRANQLSLPSQVLRLAQTVQE